MNMYEGDELWQRGEVGPLINEVERWCGLEIDHAEFFRCLRAAYDKAFLDGIAERIAAPVQLTLCAWAEYQLELLNESDAARELLGPGSLASTDRSEREWSVINGLTQFFSRQTLPRDGYATLTRLSGEFQLLRSFGYGARRQTRSVFHWLAALFRQGQWQAAMGVAREYAAAHWWQLWQAFLLQNPHAAQALLAAMSPEERDYAAAILAGWLRAAAEDARDALWDDAGPQLVPEVAAAALGVWERSRDDLAAADLHKADEGAFWGGWLWSLQALVSRLRWLREARDDDRPLARQLADHLEGFATRMALVCSAPTESAAVSLQCGPDNPSVVDPNPLAEACDAGLPFPAAGRILNGAEKTRAFTPLASRKLITRCSPSLYRELTRKLDLGRVAANLPTGTAYLSLADLPFTHTPVGVLVARDSAGDIHIEVAAAALHPERNKEDELRDYTRGDAMLRFERAFAATWSKYETDVEAVGSEQATEVLAHSLVNLSQQRAATLNRAYGGVIDELFQRMDASGLSQSHFRETDLVVAARGLAQLAHTELLGRNCRVRDWSASVTHVPSLSIFAHLWERAASRTRSSGALQIAAAGWEPVRPCVNGTKPAAGHGDGVWHLMQLLNKNLASVSKCVLRTACEAPVATLERTACLLNGSDLAVIYGHGRTAPCGVRLADGLFPDDLPRVIPQGPAVLLLAGCYAGRLSQPANRLDGFSPIIDEVVLRMMLSNTTFADRQPTLIGAIVEAVPTVYGAELVSDLLTERLTGDGLGAEFGYARALRRILLRYEAAGVGLNGQGLLRLFTARSWRLTGVEGPARQLT